jgi:hypothetical protein
MEPVEILILGAGWTFQFLIPLLKENSISYSATNRRSSDTVCTLAPSIEFTFDPISEDPAPYHALPDATTVLITFPITIPGAVQRLVNHYKSTRSQKVPVSFILLGSTRAWGVSIGTIH